MNDTVGRGAAFGADMAVVGMLGCGPFVLLMSGRHRLRSRRGLIIAARMSQVQHLRSHSEKEYEDAA